MIRILFISCFLMRYFGIALASSLSGCVACCLVSPQGWAFPSLIPFACLSRVEVSALSHSLIVFNTRHYQALF